MVDKDGAGSCWLGGGVEGAGVGSENFRDIFIKIAYFTCHSTDNLGLIRWEMGECLGSFGMLDLTRSDWTSFGLNLGSYLRAYSPGLHTLEDGVTLE